MSSATGTSEQVLATFERLFALDAELGGGMQRYLGFGPDPESIRQFERYARDIAAVSGRDVKGMRVLDAGCGYGLFLVVCGLYGAASLHGIDVDAGAVDFARAYRSELPDGLADRFRVEIGDVMQLQYDDATFDLVTSIEAASHYLDVDVAFAEIARVLRPGGSLVISDGNNALNSRYAAGIRELWVAVERGPGNRTIAGHQIGKPYEERREEIIREHAPGLADDDVRRLARSTTGYVRPQIVAAVDEFQRDGAEPRPRRNDDEVPVDPEGATHERLFDPFELARTLGTVGFRDVRVRGYWGGASGRVPVRVANRLLGIASRYTMPTARGFRIHAVRS